MTAFAQILNNCNDRAASVMTEIEVLECQLNDKREELQQIEAEKQRLETMAGAGQSAIEQAQKFLGLAEMSGRQDMIEAFRSAILQIFDHQPPIAEIEPGTDPEPPTAPSGDAHPPEPPTDDGAETPANAIAVLPPVAKSVGAAAKDYDQWLLSALRDE